MDGFCDFLADAFVPFLIVVGWTMVVVMTASLWLDPEFR